MKKVLYLGLVMVLCFSMIGCSNSNAFKVGETEFSNEEVDKVKSILTATQSYTDANYLAQFKESKDNDDKIKQEVISYMIDNEVVYQQAQKEKIKVTDDEVNQKYSQIEKMLDTNQEYKKLLDDAGVDEDYLKETIKKDLAVQKYRENFEQDLKVTDKEVEKYYKEHKDDFKEESVEAYHILVSTLDDNNKPVDDSKKEELKSKAESLLKEIKNGGDFEKIAKENSDDKSSGKKGGYLGYFTKDSKNAQFTKEAFKLEKGQVSNVFETPFGYEIVKVTNKKTEQKSLEDSREEIVNRILADKYLDQVNSLREKSDVQRF
ncbi:peptidylprolyl isomerase [Intestinibacter bartlettii]|nr:peptidylprolyl isomerase [Intestinibacter bartlettii]MCC2707450.1 peptidylprolyl isomerase [Intestinibacter bartlettii]MCC2762900.1 peptidylprolyl isomerase [Intestinibacter bartlettii]MDU6473246.1 peptidylprolyl isomerase [Intestinibacter bartlettii]